MGIPEGSFAVAAFIVVALPGFIFAGVRRWLCGESAEDRNVGLTIARGTVFAVTLTAVYLLLFGAKVFEGLAEGASADTLIVTDSHVIGRTILFLYILIPTVISVALNLRHTSWRTPAWPGKTPGWMKRTVTWVRVPGSKHGYSATQDAWNHSTSRNQKSWVKVKRSNGEWVGGWYTRGSYVTSYPEPRSIYIDQQWALSSEGEFTEAIPHAGAFLMINDDDLVIWITPDKKMS